MRNVRFSAAQRRAHALEHDHSYVGIEWRIRFFKHYYRVFKGGAAPEPGMKPYSRFYQYVYVAIYRELKQLQAEANKPRQIEPTSSDVTFDPIDALTCFRKNLNRKVVNLSHVWHEQKKERFYPLFLWAFTDSKIAVQLQ